MALGSFSGIKFDALGIRLVHGISPYEFVRAYGHDDTTAQLLAKNTNIHLIAASIPSKTSLAIIDSLSSRLRDIRDSSVVVDDLTPYAAPAATAQVLLNGSSTKNKYVLIHI
jgi:hypothetical protein